VPGHDPDWHNEVLITDRAIPNVMVTTAMATEHASGIDEFVAKLLAVALYAAKRLRHLIFESRQGRLHGNFHPGMHVADDLDCNVGARSFCLEEVDDSSRELVA